MNAALTSLIVSEREEVKASGKSKSVQDKLEVEEREIERTIGGRGW